MLPKHRGSYLVLRIGLKDLNPSGFLLPTCCLLVARLLLLACFCLPAAASACLLPTCSHAVAASPACCLLLACCFSLLLLACLPAACFLPLLPRAWCFPRRCSHAAAAASTACCLVLACCFCLLLLACLPAACFLPLLPRAWCFPRRRLSGLIWLRPGSGWRLRSEALPLPRLEITLIRPCRSMRKYADKRHVDVATLRPFGQFLYLLPPWAAKNGLLFHPLAQNH